MFLKPTTTKILIFLDIFVAAGFIPGPSVGGGKLPDYLPASVEKRLAFAFLFFR